MTRSFPGTLAIITFVAASLAHAEDGATLDGFERFVRDDGSIQFSPSQMGDSFRHLGSWFVPSGDSAGFHHVYTQPEAITAYRETGRFPDGTALIKQIITARRDSYTTGENVASATENKVWFVMIKDAQGRFRDSGIWGRGWGWALYDGPAPAENQVKDFEKDCIGCHVPAQVTDLVYVGGYPTLSGD